MRRANAEGSLATIQFIRRATPPARCPAGTSPQGLLVAAFVLVAFGTVLATRRRPRT